MGKVIFSSLGPRITGRLIAAVTAIAICFGGYKILGAYYSTKAPSAPPPSDQATTDGEQPPTEDQSGGPVEDPDNLDDVYRDENAESIGATISSASALLCDNKNNAVICKKSIDTPITAMAVLSLSVALTVADAVAAGDVSPTERAVCPAAAYRLPCYAEGSTILSVGKALTVAELVKCLFCTSPELFAYTLAVHISGNESAFAEKMNDLIKSIGATQTEFRSISDVNSQTTTAMDAAKIFRAVTENSVLLNLLSSRASFTVSAGGTAWDAVTLCNKFYLECCTEGQSKADGIICGYYFESNGKQFTYVLFDRPEATYSAIALSSDTAYADALIMLSRV